MGNAESQTSRDAKFLSTCYYGDSNEALKMIQKGNIDINMNDGKPLYCVCIHNNTYLAKLLIDNGADVITVHKGKNYLFETCRHNNLELVKYLVEKGADPKTEAVVATARLMKHDTILKFLEERIGGAKN